MSERLGGAGGGAAVGRCRWWRAAVVQRHTERPAAGGARARARAAKERPML